MKSYSHPHIIHAVSIVLFFIILKVLHDDLPSGAYLTLIAGLKVSDLRILRSKEVSRITAFSSSVKVWFF